MNYIDLIKNEAYVIKVNEQYLVRINRKSFTLSNYLIEASLYTFEQTDLPLSQIQEAGYEGKIIKVIIDE